MCFYIYFQKVHEVRLKTLKETKINLIILLKFYLLQFLYKQFKHQT
jgi:hypothetical protein